jgi:hypothetical protein
MQAYTAGPAPNPSTGPAKPPAPSLLFLPHGRLSLSTKQLGFSPSFSTPPPLTKRGLEQEADTSSPPRQGAIPEHTDAIFYLKPTTPMPFVDQRSHPVSMPTTVDSNAVRSVDRHDRQLC